MSLRQIQTRNFLEYIISSYLASGKRPTDTEVFKALNFYFSKQPAGKPVRISPNTFTANVVSNVDDINDFMACVQVNLDNLFQQLDEHLQQNSLLTTALTAQMKSLRTNRRRLEGRVDDLLLGLYNTDGYFYSVSDDFYDATLTDFTYTNAFLDIESGVLALPSNADKTKVMSLYEHNDPSVEVYKKSDITNEIPFTLHTPFNNAVDGLTNTAWYMTIRRSEPSEGVFVRLSIDVYGSLTGSEITQINLTPHGVEPVQCSVQKVVEFDAQTSTTSPFSNYVKTSAEKITFINENSSDSINKLIFEFAKERPDYYENNLDGTRSGVYVIGIKELMVTQQAYDPTATFVSKPISITPALVNDHVIDAVTMTTTHSIPPNSQIKYYVAPDNEDAASIDDFDWTSITPLSESNKNAADSIVKFGGASRQQVYVRRNLRSDTNDIPQIKINEYSNDLEVKNPNYSLTTEFPIYRIAKFDELFLTGTLSLEEGINTTKILHTELSDDNINDTFSFWAAKFDDSGSYESAYGETDIGNGFFYGGNLAENERSVYVETGVYVDQDYPVVLKDIVKSDAASKLWTVKAYLNGREIADMPVGIDRVSAPLKLSRGKNVVVFAINIPSGSDASGQPHIGSMAFNMDDFGGFKLGELTYVDLFKFKNDGYSEDDNIFPNKWFTLYNGEIVTRSKPTTNYRLRFVRPTDKGPSAVRLRADLSRFDQNHRVSPVFDSYRVRFSYANEDL